MYKRLMLVVLLGLCFSLVANSVNSAPFEKMKATPLQEDQFHAPSVPPFPDGDFCMLQYDDGTAVWFSAQFDSGSGVVGYMDPEKCATSTPYPYKITDVHFYLYGGFSDSVTWPVEIQVNIREVAQDDECNGPGDLLFSQSFVIPVDSGWANLGRPMNLSLGDSICTSYPFFLEIMYTTDSDSLLPSFLMDDAVAPADSCNTWGLQSGQYIRWSDFWDPPPPGEPILRATGYTDDVECWYWKPDRPDQGHPAPSGMPDFDQNQAGWQAYCGPVAVANCLWWFDAVPEGMSPPDLVGLLAEYFHTRAPDGTYVDTMQMGLEQYFQDFGFALQESTFEMPNFNEMEDSLKACQDIILLLGFWWSEDGVTWHRQGGHYVTMAGVCSESLKIAISDPDWDGAVQGAPGRVRPPDHPAAGQYEDTLHNDPTYVSHDTYDSDITPNPPSPGNPYWEINYPYSGKYSGMNVPQKFEAVTKPAPKNVQFYATEVEYAVMICPKSTGVEEEGEEGTITPEDFGLYQSYPNPFNNQTIIKYDLLKSCQVTLTIYNILGQKVKTLVDGYQEAGSKIIGWDGEDEKGKELASGIYFYQLRAGDVTQTRRMVLLK